MIILGITGTNGAGKGVVVDYLAMQKGFTHYSARELLIEEIKKRSMPINRESMILVSNDLRANNSPSYVVEELYKKALQYNKNAVIESIRVPGEVEFLKSKDNFYLIAIDADLEQRYKRVQFRKSDTDKVSFDEFVEIENKEMDNKDQNKQNIRKVIEMANYTITNNGTLEELHQQIETIIQDIN